MSRLTFTQTFLTCFTAVTISFIPVKDFKSKNVNSLSGDLDIQGITCGESYFTVPNENNYTSNGNEKVVLVDDGVYHTEYIPDENGGIIRFETEEEKRNKYLKRKGQKPKQMCKVRHDKYQFYG